MFNAVASRFTGAFLSPMLPFTLTVFPAAVIRLMGSVHRPWLRLVGVATLYWMMPRGGYSIDGVVTVGVVALLMTMHDALSRSRAHLAAMCLWTLVVMTAKSNGILFAGIVWPLYLAMVKLDRQPLGPYVRRLPVALAAFLLLTLSPFVTSTIDCGHPLYPVCSGDRGHPAVDLCADFLEVTNGDYREMGRWGAFANAYISPGLARAYYGWRLKRRDFRPTNANFGHPPNVSADRGATPVHWQVRLAFWVSALLLCVWGRSRGAFVVAATLLCLAAMPLQMIGYVRYVPWMMAPVLFLLVEAERRSVRCRLAVVAGCTALVVAARPTPLTRQLFDVAFTIETGEMARELMPVFGPSRPFLEGQASGWRVTGREVERIARLPTETMKEYASAYVSYLESQFHFVRGDQAFQSLVARCARDAAAPSTKFERYVRLAWIYGRVLPRVIARRVWGALAGGCRLPPSPP